MDNKINKNVRHGNKKRKRTSKKFSWGLMVGFILFELVFTIVTAPFVLLYGPFENAKSRFVGTAMGSMNYQWLATTFLSDEKISEIIGDKQSDENNVENTDGSLINIPKVKDNNITYATLDKNNNFTGHVLIINNPTRVKVGYTSKLNYANPEGETTSQIAMNNGAVAAVNGGAFTDEADTAQWTANGGTPSGVIISEGKIVYDDTAGKELGTVGITAEGKLVAGRFSTCLLYTSKMWIRHVVVPGLTDGEEHIKRFNEYIQDIPNVEKVELLPYHLLGVNKYEGLNIPYPLEGTPEMNKEVCEGYKKLITR